MGECDSGVTVESSLACWDYYQYVNVLPPSFWALQHNMKFRSVQVECYSGSRADERPRRVVIDGCEHLVAHLLGESIEESAETRERITRFTGLTEEGQTIELIHTEGGEWYLVSIQG